MPLPVSADRYADRWLAQRQEQRDSERACSQVSRMRDHRQWGLELDTCRSFQSRNTRSKRLMMLVVRRCAAAHEPVGIVSVDENGGGAGVRLRKGVDER